MACERAYCSVDLEHRVSIAVGRWSALGIRETPFSNSVAIQSSAETDVALAVVRYSTWIQKPIGSEQGGEGLPPTAQAMLAKYHPPGKTPLPSRPISSE
jgi:hypothetical protein